MSFTTQLYDHTAFYLSAGVLASASTDIKVALYGGSATFNAAHTTRASISGEVHGNGWPDNGVALTGLNWVQANVNEAKLECNTVSVTATGGAITATYGLVYQSIYNRPLIWIDFDGQKSAPDTYDFILSWSDGMLVVAP